MSNYTWKYIEQHPQEVKWLLGINDEQLKQLLEQGKILHQIKQESIEQHKTIIIKAGVGKPAKLPVGEQIILTIIYLRHNLAFQLLGLLFKQRKGSLILEIVKAGNSEKTIEVIKHHSFGLDLPLVTSKT